MSLAAEYLNGHTDVPRQFEDETRFSESALEQSPQMPANPFLSRINTLLPRLSEGETPVHLDLGVLKPYMQKLYEASWTSDQVPAGQTFQSQPTEARAFAGLSTGDPEPQTAGQVEVGQNYYFNPTDQRNYPSKMVRGTAGRIDLNEDLYDLAEHGLYPFLTMHVHPDTIPPRHSLYDWQVAVAQRNPGETTPMVNAIGIIGKDAQVVAVMTEDSHQLLDDDAITDLLEEWFNRFKQRGNPERAALDRRVRQSRGKAKEQAKAELEALLQWTEDELATELAEAMGAVMYISRNMADFYQATPEIIIQTLREMAIAN